MRNQQKICIFQNVTKHLKNFLIQFSKMQPNTRKYFPFPKIFSPENILHSENNLHVAKHSLSKFGMKICQQQDQHPLNVFHNDKQSNHLVHFVRDILDILIQYNRPKPIPTCTSSLGFNHLYILMLEFIVIQVIVQHSYIIKM